MKASGRFWTRRKTRGGGSVPPTDTHRLLSRGASPGASPVQRSTVLSFFKTIAARTRRLLLCSYRVCVSSAIVSVATSNQKPPMLQLSQGDRWTARPEVVKAKTGSAYDDDDDGAGLTAASPSSYIQPTYIHPQPLARTGRDHVSCLGCVCLPFGQEKQPGCVVSAEYFWLL